MQEVIQLFNDAGWLANFLGILSVLATGLLIFFRLVRPYVCNTRLQSVVPSNFVRDWNEVKAKAIARIAIVDDQPQDFPTAELKADGYQVQVFRQATLANTSELATFDVIFLDMKGIVKDDPEHGGLKLIAELRKTNPAQKICAVSSKTFDPTATEFFRQADDYKRKPLTAQECRSVIDRFLVEVFAPNPLLQSARSVIAGLPRRKRGDAVSAIRSFTHKALNRETLERHLGSLGLNKTSRQHLINLARATESETL